MLIVGFFFATVSGNLVGMIGSYNNPISGLTLSTLIIAALLMVALGIRGPSGVAVVLGVAAVVCVSSAVAGELLQDFKVGYILGGTPRTIQIVELIAEHSTGVDEVAFGGWTRSCGEHGSTLIPDLVTAIGGQDRDPGGDHPSQRRRRAKSRVTNSRNDPSVWTNNSTNQPRNVSISGYAPATSSSRTTMSRSDVSVARPSTTDPSSHA